jgi:hypothetical protein
MMYEVPFYDSVQPPGGSWKSEGVISRPRATLQCLQIICGPLSTTERTGRPN